MTSALGSDAGAVLAAALERILPEDEHGPGARALGVVGYVEAALARGDEASRERWRAALLALDAQAGAPGFAALAGAEQDRLLEELADDGGTFFAELRGRALEGVFCDPAHGGNAGGAGWRLLGYDGPRHVWTADDQRLGELPARP